MTPGSFFYASSARALNAIFMFEKSDKGVPKMLQYVYY